MSCMNKFIPRIALLLLAAECVLVLLSWLLEATQTRYLLLRITQCQVAQETFVVLVNLVIDEGFLTSQL